MNSENATFFQKHKFYIYLILVGIFVYCNGLFGSFVWDDVYQIQKNILVHSVGNFLSFFLGSTFSPENSSQLGGIYYRPLMSLSFSIIYTLFGPQTFPYHLLQLSVHIANALLLFFLLKKFFKESVAFFLSLIFLIHPIQVESVVYISTLEEPLFTFFGLLALILFMKEKLNVKKYLLVFLLLLASIFSKETGILFGLVVIMYYFLFKKYELRDTIKTIGVVVVQILFYFFLRFDVAKVYFQKIPDVPMMTAPLTERIFSMPAIFLFYIKTFFFPINLFIYQEWMVQGLTADFFVPLLIDITFLGIVCGIGFWLWRLHKKFFLPFVFFTLWLLLGIGFHLQLQPLDMTVADHMFYFPMIGLLGILGVLVQNVKIANPTLRIWGIYIMVIILCLFVLRTFVRNANWYSGTSLYSNDIHYQQNDRLENLLAASLFESGQYVQAQKYFEEILSRNPHQSALIFNLGMIYESEGDYQKEENFYDANLSSDDTGVLYANYARVLMLKEGKLQKAKEISSKGLARFPQNTTLLLINAIAAYKLGDKQTALTEVQQAEKISSDPRINQMYQEIQNDSFTL